MVELEENVLDIAQTLKDGLRHHQDGDLHKANEKYAKVLEIEPENGQALHLAGMLAYDIEDYLLALDFILRAVEASPQDALYRNNLANVLFALDEIPAAAEQYEKAIELKPDYAEAHFNFAGVFFKQDNFDQALPLYQKAVEINKDFTAAWNNMGGTYLGKDDLNQAIRCYAQAYISDVSFISAKENLVDALFERVQQQVEKTNFSAAIEDLERIQELDPQHAQANELTLKLNHQNS